MPPTLGLKKRRGRPPNCVQCSSCLGQFPSRYFDRYHSKHCWIKPIMELIQQQIAAEEAAAAERKYFEAA